MSAKGKLVVVSGFSGAGKGTVMNATIEKYPNFSLSVSATTRKPREGEVDGREYTASVPISNSAAPKKIVIYYDKNSPETIYTPPTGTKDAFILSAILAFSGVAVLVWRR